MREVSKHTKTLQKVPKKKLFESLSLRLNLHESLCIFCDCLVNFFVISLEMLWR